MKKTLLIMVMALAVLLTQCRKPEVKFPSPVAPEGTTVSMTVTAGPGSKTDITPAGGITWSSGDKLYVGDGSKYVGYLTIVSGVGTPTGTFSGDVTLTGIMEGTPHTFGFYYLGSAERTLTVGATSAVVDFSSQNIYAEDGKLKNASAQHVGYGSASGTVKDGVVTGINVTLVSKVALARFSFKKGGTGYSNALTLSGTNIYNKMTVNFDSEGFSCTGTVGDISLTNTMSSEKYVMLVPVGSGSETLNFGGGASGTKTLENGIEANKFYGRESAIEVPVTPFVFTVDADGTTVEFSKGNLYWDGSAFKFESKQWETTPTADYETYSDDPWDASHVSHFYWSKSADVAVAYEYEDDEASTKDIFFTNATPTTANPGFHVNGETGTNQWRTLSKGEWDYLLNTSGGSSGRTDANRFAKAKVNGVLGLLIFPDGYTLPEGYTTAGGGVGMAKVNGASNDVWWPDDNIPTDPWTYMESSGVVFLPAAGWRCCEMVEDLAWTCKYWSSSSYGTVLAWRLRVEFDSFWINEDVREFGEAVRLVRGEEE